MAQIVLTQSHDDRAAAFTGAAPFSRRLRDAFEFINTPMRHAQDALRFPKSQARMTLRIREQLARGNPIVVYSAPKTASTSIAAALDRSAGLDTVKVHMVQPAHFWRGPLQSKTAPNGLLRHRAIEQVPSRELLFDTDRLLRIVSVVRDPIAFNLSNYTFFGRAYWMRSFWRSAPWISTARLMKHFLATFPHASSNMWWEHEFTRSTGINPISDGFDQARGCSATNANASIVLCFGVMFPMQQNAKRCPSGRALRCHRSPAKTAMKGNLRQACTSDSSPRYATNLRMSMRCWRCRRCTASTTQINAQRCVRTGLTLHSAIHSQDIALRATLPAHMT